MNPSIGPASSTFTRISDKNFQEISTMDLSSASKIDDAIANFRTLQMQIRSAYGDEVQQELVRDDVIEALQQCKNILLVDPTGTEKYSKSFAVAANAAYVIDNIAAANSWETTYKSLSNRHFTKPQGE